MNNITMTVTAGTAEELFSTIKGMAVLIREDCPAAVPIEPTAAAPTLPVSLPQQAPLVPMQPPIIPPQAPVVPTPPSAPVSSTVPMAPPTSPAPTYTLDQLNRAGADLITARPDAMPFLSAFLTELGVQTLSQLKPEMYGSVALKLRELGAAI